MTAQGLPVPPGFVVPAYVLEQSVDAGQLRKLAQAQDAEGAQALIQRAEPPRTAIISSYERLGGRVAVRSSACAEDSEIASYAGQQETYLNTLGGEEVCARLVDCWASFFSERALFYRAQKGSLGDLAMAVVVQKMLEPVKFGILMNQNIMRPQTLLSLRGIPDLAFIQSGGGDQAPYLRIGAMTTHRSVESAALVHQMCPILASTFSLVASPRVRNQATVGGVLADADYASDPPALLHALNAKTLVRSTTGEREIPVEELILGYYETSLRPDELLVELRVPYNVERAVYRKFRSRSSEDRPCVAVAAAQVARKLRVVLGAVAERPQYFPAICALAAGESAGEEGRPYSRELAREIARRYAESIDPISDSRGSAEYRRRVIAVEVRRALEEMSSASVQFAPPTGSEEVSP